MVEKHIPIINKLGLHARAATKLAQTAARYGCVIKAGNGQTNVDAKSVMSLMLLAVSCGRELYVSTDGDDELEAMDAIEALINDRFGEEE